MAAAARSFGFGWTRDRRPRLGEFLCGLGLLGLSLGAAEPAGTWETGDGYRRARLAVAPDGTPGFTAMPPETTGIAFTNYLSVRDASFNNNFMTGSGVAAGDFDGDGWCDLYFCAIGGVNALYRNLGNWHFEDVTAAARVGCARWRSTGALWADVDADGDLDLLVATLGSGVHLFVNDGGGRFREATAEAGLAAETGSTSLAMADLDGDGDLDLYVANYGAISVLRSGSRPDLKRVNGQWVVTGPYANRFRTVNGELEEVGELDVVYLNDGRGHFRALPWDSEYFLDEQGQPKPGPTDYGLTVQLRDLNEDHIPDIYVCNDFQTVDRIWLNDGTAHFRALPRVALRKQSFSAMGVDFADLDRDGHFDFLVTEMMSRDHRLRMRQVVGMQPMLPEPGRIESRPEVARNTLFWNRGDTTFAELANYSGVAATDWSWQPIFLDVDLDGYDDLLIGNGMMFDVQDRDVLNHVRSLGSQPAASARTNLTLYPPFNSPNLAFRNRHDLTFEDTSRPWRFESTRISQGLALADLDHDGDLDLVINCLNAPPLLYRNDTPAARLAVRLRGPRSNPQGINALIRVRGGPVGLQMHELTCGGHYLSGDDPAFAFAAGQPTNRFEIEVLWRDGRRSVITGAEANCLYEIDAASAEPAPKVSQPAAESQPFLRDVSQLLAHTHHEELSNDFARQPLLHRLLSQAGPGVAWVDLDGDGQDELVIGAGRGSAPAAFRRAPSGEFTLLPGVPRPAPDDLAGLAAWPMADGRRCLVAGQSSYESNPTNSPPPFTIFFLDPAGQFRQVSLSDAPLLRDCTGPVAVADVDGDGDLDIFLGGRVIPGAYPEPATSRILLQQDGRLVPDRVNAAVLERVGLVSGALWTDLDGNGYPDLVLACEWGPIRVFRNEGGRLTEFDPPVETQSANYQPFPPGANPSRLSQLTGWWNGVAAADLDEDGRLDLIVSNWGLNTGYAANPDFPIRIYYGDLGSQGAVDLIESYYPPEMPVPVAVPRRTLNALSQAILSLADRYPTHAAFSTTTLADLLAAVPTKPRVVSATTLASLILLNRGTNLLVRALPPEAQYAPAFAVAIGDLEGDGHDDVFLSQNFFAMRPEWPRLDAGRGLWLRGNGRGDLVPVSGEESGIEVYGEQRGAAVGDFNGDGRADLVVTQNGAATRLYENVRARPGLRVRLRGPESNRSGIGAVVRVEFKERFGPAREVHGGSGYWSQDSLVPVLGTPEPPQRVHVLWPSGKRTRTPVPAGAREVTAAFTDEAVGRRDSAIP